ncbi:LAME_0B01310g1_1 [Lachancea meyersii CBS 8951]|uniref:LAME_0B01310g1_1 n=1 Tax=Lachancea meyersii CBS 8951 TaxID=1266667 RepID=A0A1G4ITM0_9SACH|nr:LAME_0B01310g1_1 [Lachancea meyersii CBS 8951]
MLVVLARASSTSLGFVSPSGSRILKIIHWLARKHISTSKLPAFKIKADNETKRGGNSTRRQTEHASTDQNKELYKHSIKCEKSYWVFFSFLPTAVFQITQSPLGTPKQTSAVNERVALIFKHRLFKDRVRLFNSAILKDADTLYINIRSVHSDINCYYMEQAVRINFEDHWLPAEFESVFVALRGLLT